MMYKSQKLFLLYKINCGSISRSLTCVLMAIADFEEINRPCSHGWSLSTAAASVTGIEFKGLSQNPLIPCVGGEIGRLPRTQTPLKTSPSFTQLFFNWCISPLRFPWVRKISLTPLPIARLFLWRKTTPAAANWTAGTTCYIFYDWLILPFTLVTVSGARRAFPVFWKYFSATLEVSRYVGVLLLSQYLRYEMQCAAPNTCTLGYFYVQVYVQYLM